MNITHQIGTRGSIANPQKDLILQDAADSILRGESLQQIAARHNIGRSTLSLWLSQMDGYDEIRSLWIDQSLEEGETLLRDAQDQLELSRARELLKHFQWRAGVRDKRYAAKQELTVEHINMSDAIQRGRQRARLIQGEATRVEDQAQAG